MSAKTRLGIASTGLFLALMPGRLSAQTTSSAPPPPPPGRVISPPLEGPATELEPIPPGDPSQHQAPAGESQPPDSMPHDALAAGEASAKKKRVYAPQQPPAPIVERPGGRRPGVRAIWIPGYWDWDASAAEFVWIGGVWQIPPPAMIWVAGRWIRDDSGWYRAGGTWSPRRDAVVVRNELTPSRQPRWRATGPPADPPESTVAPAPGPDYFLVAGHFEPAGDQLKWKPGFWASIQPGWEWIPARWVRLSTGWEFRAGNWARETDATDLRVTVGGRSNDRRIARKPALPPRETSSDEPEFDHPPAPPGGGDERDPIAEAEEVPPVVVLPRDVLPFYVIRPPGSYLYGPGGVVVPGVVPPFVRRILDRVLP